MQGNVSRLPEEQAHSQQTMIDKQFLNMTGWSYELCIGEVETRNNAFG
jgi:hypothetical protein